MPAKWPRKTDFALETLLMMPVGCPFLIGAQPSKIALEDSISQSAVENKRQERSREVALTPGGTFG
jgi:hypothetical protein